MITFIDRFLEEGKQQGRADSATRVQTPEKTWRKAAAGKSSVLVSDRLTYTYTRRHDRQANRP
jgi:hypothetical protein